MTRAYAKFLAKRIAANQMPTPEDHDQFHRALTDQLKRDEGFMPHAYECTSGALTIGYGRNIDEKFGGGISRMEAEFLLQNDLNRVISQIRTRWPWFDRLDEARKGVLCAMAFQMGLEGLGKFALTLKHVEAGDYAKASAEMLDSTWSRQTPARAQRLADQMRLGWWR